MREEFDSIEFLQKFRIAETSLRLDDSLFVIHLGLNEAALAIINRAQIDQSAGGAGVQLHYFLVGFYCLFHRGAGLFEVEPSLKPGFRLAEPVAGAFALGKSLHAAEL